jgi:hypothetical protein
MHFLNNSEKQKWIENYVERETAGARKQVEDAEVAVQKEQAYMKYAEIAELTNRKLEMTFEEMMVAIGDSLSDLACSGDREDQEDEHADTVHDKLSEYN